MVCGCLLSRAGLKTLVLERNDDFEREFRGEVLQPRFHKAMQDVGLFDHIAEYPHEEIERMYIHYEGRPIGSINVRRLDKRAGTTWWMTQPDLLRALADYGHASADFEIQFGAALRKLDGNSAWIERDGEDEEINAKVIIGADGRFSTVRKLGGFDFEYDQHDMDVIWFILPRPEGYEHFGNFFLTRRHNYLILPKHPNLLQCGLVLKPGEFSSIRHSPISLLKEELAKAHPVFADFAAGLKDFSPFRPLKGSTSMVREWAREGLVLIGDAAHTCSPAGGIGVAIAVETACVAASVVQRCFEKNDFSQARLSKIQLLRQDDVRRVHAAQHRAGSALVGGSGFTRRVAALAIRLASATGIFPFLARQMLTQTKPLPLSAELSD